MSDERIIPCQTCGSEGRRMSASNPTAAPIICAGCKDVIQMPGTYLQVRGKNYHEQCVWKCVGHGYGNYAPITVTKQPQGNGQ